MSVFMPEGGGKNVSKPVKKGSIMGTYDIGCKLQRKRLECAIMIKAKLMLDEIEETEK